MIIDAGNALLRPFRLEDAAELARLANDARVAAMLRDRFPHPYTLADAEARITFVTSEEPLTNFAIESGGRLAGAIGIEPFAGEHRFTGELGYWLGAEHWGRGIATSAVLAIATHALDHLKLLRLQASVFEWNAASARVLEKAGFTFEGRLRRHVVKGERVGDVLMYARTA